MEVKKIVEGMTAVEVAEVIDSNFKAQNKILEEDIAKQNNVIGVSEYKDFSEDEAVSVGDVRKYNGFLYECTEEMQGAWVASKWKKSSFKKEIEDKLITLEKETKESLESFDEDIKEIINCTVGGVEEYKTLYGYLILEDGGIMSYQTFKIGLFHVEPNKKYKIHNTIKGSSLRPSYAIYSSEELTSGNCLKIGDPINNYNEDIYITTPENAYFIAIQSYNSDYGVYEVDEIKNVIPSFSNEIKKLKDESEKGKVGFGDNIQYKSYVYGYIYYDGSIDPNASFTTYLYPVEPNKKYWVYSGLRSGISRMYAVYSSNEIAAETAVSIGVGVSDTRPDYVLVSTPANAAYIGISSYGGSGHGVLDTKNLDLKETEKEVQSLKKDVESIASASGKRMVVELAEDGENLYVAYLDENKTEFVFWFKKCMFNELYTFYRVGYRNVEREYPSTEGISILKDVVVINETGSDNIGPILFKNGRWAGGNHSYNSDGETKTAKNNFYKIYADGVILKSGESRFVDVVQVKVENTIYNPNGLPSSVVPISIETVDYSIQNNNIEVSIRQKFADINNPVERYYGMQSMFKNDSQLLIPNGGVDNWIDAPSELYINKSDFPKVNRFIERNKSKGVYQSSYLRPNKDGNHNMVNSEMFNRSNSKCYHYIIDHETIVANEKVVWTGVYTFFSEPISDNENVFVYSGVINGKDAIYINTKKAFEGSINLPAKFLMKKMQIVEKDETISTSNEFVDSEGIEINASGTGSMIVLLE